MKKKSMDEKRSDEILVGMKFCNFLKKRLQIQFHGWGKDVPHSCKNFYLNGHFGRHHAGGKAYMIRGNLEMLLLHHGPPDLEKMKAFLEDPSKPLDHWVYLHSGLEQCSSCGQRLKMETDGHVVRIAGEPCKYPRGYPAWSVEIDVPSGKLILDDDLRPWFRETENKEGESRVSFESTAGEHRLAKIYAAHGMLTAFVGNTCPGVYRVSGQKDTFHLGLTKHVFENESDEWGEPAPLMEGTEERVASISTGLWWYSIADYDKVASKVPVYREYDSEKGKMVFVERPGGKIPGTVVEVTPGRYRATNYVHLLDRDDYQVDRLFAKIERVG